MNETLHPQKRHTYMQWTPTDISFLRNHPDMTADELAEALGRTRSSVECGRHRFGRYPARGEHLCVCCEERVVYVESPTARKWRLCKGCYLRELRMRESEEAEANRLRQMKHKRLERRRKADGEG